VPSSCSPRDEFSPIHHLTSIDTWLDIGVVQPEVGHIVFSQAVPTFALGILV
jgi:hypothetical protein